MNLIIRPTKDLEEALQALMCAPGCLGKEFGGPGKTDHVPEGGAVSRKPQSSCLSVGS